MRIANRILGAVFVTLAFGTALAPSAGATSIAPADYHSDCVFQNGQSCTSGEDEGRVPPHHRDPGAWGYDSGAIVRDHRDRTGPVVRDHRTEHGPIIRDHRTEHGPIIRDHRH